MLDRDTILDNIIAQGREIERQLRQEMATQGIHQRAERRYRNMANNTVVFVDIADGFNINDKERIALKILKKITVLYPLHGLFRERGDYPVSRKGKIIKATQRDRKPLFTKILPTQIEKLKNSIAELYGVQIAGVIHINIPGIYSSGKYSKY
jgi:hypothetical protein